jgi:nucleotide-binding universal stress UspA family protein
MKDRPTILLPVGVLEGESIPEGVPELLANAHVVLLGYHVVPDQTATDQARDQFEDQATRRLNDFTEMLEEAGASVESRLVFTHDGQKTIDRISSEEECLAVLIPNAARPIENILVPIRGIVGIDRFVRLLSGLLTPADDESTSSRIRSVLTRKGSAPSQVNITLLHIVEENETEEDAETLLNGIATRLSEEGIPRDVIDIEVSRGDNSQEMIVDAADDYDVIVMGESDPSVTTFLFGMSADQVAEQFLGPVFVIQHGEADNEEETDTD